MPLVKENQAKGLLNSLSKKLFVAFVLVLLPIVITFVVGYSRNKNQIKAEALNDVVALAEGYEGLVYQFLEMNKRRAADFASDGFVRDSLKKITGGDKSGAGALNAHLIRNKLPLDNTLRSIYVMDRFGRVAASTEKNAVGKDFSDMKFFGSALKGVSAQEAANGPEPRLAIAVPVTDKDTGKILGVLANFILLTELDKLLSGEFGKDLGAISFDRGRKATLEVYMVNSDGYFITKSRFVKDVVLKQRVSTPPVMACVNSLKETEGFYKDYRGVDVAGAAMCLPQLGWTLLAEFDAAELMAPVNDMLRDAVLSGGIVIILVGIMFATFVKKVVRPVEEMSDVAGYIAFGHYDVAIPIKSKDEVGRLAESFNAMASAIKARTSQIGKSEKSLSEAQRIARLGNWDWDIVKNELSWSDEIYRIFGLKPHEFGATYEAFLNAVHPDDRKVVVDSVNFAIYERKPYSIDHRVVRPDGSVKVVHEQGEVMLDGGGRAIRMIGTVQDVTEQRQAEVELKRLSTAIEQSINIIFITDKNGVFEYVNRKFEEVTGYFKEDVIGQTPAILASGEMSEAEYSELWETVLSGKTWRGVFKNKKKNNEFFWVNGIITPIIDDNNEIISLLAVQEDITEKMRDKDRIEYLSERDELTGLYNRNHFMRLIEEWIFRNKSKEDAKAILVLINIDGFQVFNDTYGHLIGDEYLKTAARTLELVVHDIDSPELKQRSKDFILSRLGGDEFALFCPLLSVAEGLEICKLVRDVFEEFCLGEGIITLTASSGVVFYPEHATTTKELFTMVDAALHRAKELGGNKTRVFRAEDRVLEGMHSRIKQKDLIVKALQAKRFEPWFQPIVDLRTGETHHYEVLARMRGEDGSVILPAFFIDVAEKFGIIGDIDKAMTGMSIDLLSEMNRKGKTCTFCMNLSGNNFSDEEFFLFLREKIAGGNIKSGQIVFEITETAAVHDLGRAQSFISGLKELGCSFALDDFGVGFTSFLYLKQLDVDYIKIDGSFVRKLNENKSDQLFVRAITDVARGMGIKTIAEFVENEDTMKLLKTIGVDYAQGYYIGKPAPVFGAEADKKKA
ncbi:MAG TPA: EAL domain-containing protein [Thermodesulfobacteriota bacterium]|nr:EAL domain-containing protein [Thermodesulfobacteriota bacterium]